MNILHNSTSSINTITAIYKKNNCRNDGMEKIQIDPMSRVHTMLNTSIQF